MGGIKGFQQDWDEIPVNNRYLCRKKNIRLFGKMLPTRLARAVVNLPMGTFAG